MNRMRKCIGLFSGLLFLLAETGVTASMVPAAPRVAAESYLLIDAATGHKLVEHDADRRLAPASLTKIMTSYAAAFELQRGTVNPDDQVNISVKAWRMEGSRMFIREGTRVDLMDLLRGIIIQSGNDASVAVAEHIAGSEDAFVDLMNQHARQMGMLDTNYVNVTGLPDENHYTTANDLAKLTLSLIESFPEHYSIYAERYFTYNDIRQPNRNMLLWRNEFVDGVKTGHTEEAGYCLVASALRPGMRLVSVVMGASSEAARTTESEKLLAYGFRYFETVPLYVADESLRQLRVWGGRHDSIHLGLEDPLVLTLAKDSREDLTVDLQTAAEIHAPVAVGQELGELTVTLHDGKQVARPLVALNRVQESGFFSRLLDAVSLFFLKLFDGDPLAV